MSILASRSVDRLKLLINMSVPSQPHHSQVKNTSTYQLDTAGRNALAPRADASQWLRNGSFATLGAICPVICPA
eukprot:g34284.t1